MNTVTKSIDIKYRNENMAQKMQSRETGEKLKQHSVQQASIDSPVALNKFQVANMGRSKREMSPKTLRVLAELNHPRM